VNRAETLARRNAIYAVEGYAQGRPEAVTSAIQDGNPNLLILALVELAADLLKHRDADNAALRAAADADGQMHD
jgi:hypothetical protein